MENLEKSWNLNEWFSRLLRRHGNLSNFSKVKEMEINHNKSDILTHQFLQYNSPVFPKALVNLLNSCELGIKYCNQNYVFLSEQMLQVEPLPFSWVVLLYTLTLIISRVWHHQMLKMTSICEEEFWSSCPSWRVVLTLTTLVCSKKR